MATAWRENATGGKVAFELPVSQLTTDGIKSLASPMSSSLFAATQAGWFRSRLEHIMIPGAINRILILGYRDSFRRVNVMSRSVQSIPKLFQKFQRSKFSVVRLPAELEVIQTTQVNLPYQAIDLYLLGSAGPADLADGFAIFQVRGVGRTRILVSLLVGQQNISLKNSLAVMG